MYSQVIPLSRDAPDSPAGYLYRFSLAGYPLGYRILKIAGYPANLKTQLYYFIKLKIKLEYF
jgi:hypothetical protein